MDDTNQIPSSNSDKSFFDGSFFAAAAWCSIFIPISTALIAYLITSSARDPRFRDEVLGFEMLFLIFSLLLGIVSLCGFQQHSRKLTLLIALIGVLASCGLGFACFMLGLANALGRNC
jgi:hypothetical protein